MEAQGGLLEIPNHRVPLNIFVFTANLGIIYATTSSEVAEPSIAHLFLGVSCAFALLSMGLEDISSGMAVRQRYYFKIAVKASTAVGVLACIVGLLGSCARAHH